MLKNLYKSFVIICTILILNACGGGGGSDGNLNSTNKYPTANLGVTFEAWNNQYSGINESSIKVIDATPFNQRTIISVRLTNALNYPVFDGRTYPLGGRGNWMYDYNYTTQVLPADVTPYTVNLVESRIGLINYFSVESTDVRFTKIVTSDWCGYYTKRNPLQPNNSCVSYISIDWAQNYDKAESINLPIGYSFTALNPAFPSAQDGVRYSSQYQTDALCKLNPNTCLPILYAPTKIGRWYVGEQGYDFAGNTTGVILANTETDGDYLYLNSGKKIKINYDVNGVAQLDFNTLTTCTGVDCYLYGGNISYGVATDGYNIKGLNTTNFYYRNDMPGGISYPSVKVNRFNYAPMPINEVISNISEVRAVQPDGTLIGANSSGIYGCFNNNGSNFRPFADQLHGWKVGHLSGTSWNVTYGQSNWIPVRSTNQQQFWKVVADNTGRCQLDTVNSFTFDEIMYSQEGFLGYNMTPPQVIQHGAFAQNIINGKRYLKFYKYPPAQN